MARKKAPAQDTNPAPQDAGVVKVADPCARWKTEIEMAGRHFSKWTTRGEKVIKRYRDERSAQGADQGKRRFNLLWSNVQTLGPALYSKPPKILVSRRFNDSDRVGRVASQILERACEYELEKYDISTCIKPAVMDRLLPGMGVAWVRYEPKLQTIPAVPGVDGAPETPAYEEKVGECTPTDYVYWKDFLMSPARVWEEVRWVGRRTFPSRPQLVKRFGDEIGNAVPLSAKPQGLEEGDPAGKELERAEVWEIWDRDTKRVYWTATGFDQFLDQRDDPLKLDSFFPCPKPLFATMTNGTMIPVPDYAEYQDQADELDSLTERIAALTKALKIAGVYDKQNGDLQRLLNDGFENQLIAVDSWAAFAEKGGLKGTIDFLPITEVMEVLKGLIEARQVVKADCYEINGMSDIVRGASDPNETATAQGIKARFASLRLSSMQGDVERFTREVVRIKAEIMAEHYSAKTLLEISSIMQLPEFIPPAQVAQDPAGLAQWQQGVQQVLEQAIALLKSPQGRDLRIDVETQSMVQPDQDAERSARTQFMQAVSGFMQQAGGMLQVAPQAGPLLGEMLRFGVRGFSVGRELEASIDRFVESMGSAPQGPDPKQQAEQQKAQEDLQAKQQELQSQEIEVGKERLQVDADRKLLPLQEQLAAAQLENKRLSIMGSIKDLVQAHEDSVRSLVESAKAQAPVTEEMNRAEPPDILPAVIDSHRELMAQIGELVQALQPPPAPEMPMMEAPQ